MKNDKPINHVEVEQAEWDKREEWFKETFKKYPKALESRAFKLEKLEYYEYVHAKYINSQDPNDRLAARFLGEQKVKLERALYPSSTVRFLKKVFDVFSKPKVFSAPVPFAESISGNPEASLKDVKKQLIHAGLGSCISQLEEQIKQGSDEFSVPAAIYFKPGEKTSYKAEFKKDEEGNLEFLGFKITLDSKDGKEALSQHYKWDNDKPYTSMTAYNQLNGRAIAHSYAMDGQKQSSMTMLDFTDKDVSGNFRTKEFPLDFDYMKELSALPLKDKTRALLSRLENDILSGNRAQVTFLKNGVEETYYIEANPGQKSFTVYNDHHKKITLKDAVSIKATESVIKEEMRNKQNESPNLSSDAKATQKEPKLKVVRNTKKKTKMSAS